MTPLKQLMTLVHTSVWSVKAQRDLHDSDRFIQHSMNSFVKGMKVMCSYEHSLGPDLMQHDK